MNITAISLNELKEKLNTLIDCGALEMIQEKDGDSFRLYIPYMMNDALENYYILEDCRIKGSFLHTVPDGTTLEIIAAGTKRHALIFHLTNGTILTIWFSKCSQIIHFYQYHRIGHFWMEGQEHWRRLVYIIGTIHEKYSYLGETSCNQKERELLPLIEFAPFRYWTPLHESLDDYYYNSKDGILCMHKLALEAGDKSYARMVHLYQMLPITLQSSKWIQSFFAKKLASRKREHLYELICQKITLASESYDMRDYGQEANYEIEKIRTQFSEKLYADGFVGQYPHFEKGSAKLTAMEEHPFTILESDTFTFKIHGMVTDKNGHYLYSFK